MAARRKNAIIVSALDSAGAYVKAVEESEKYLVVIDVHKAWCGPCTVLEPMFRKLFVDLEKADQRLRIYTIADELLSDDQKKLLPSVSTKPLFIVYKTKVAIAKIHGANAPELETTILDNIPPVTDE